MMYNGFYYPEPIQECRTDRNLRWACYVVGSVGFLAVMTGLYIVIAAIHDVGLH